MTKLWKCSINEEALDIQNTVFSDRKIDKVYIFEKLILADQELRFIIDFVCVF